MATNVSRVEELPDDYDEDQRVRREAEAAEAAAKAAEAAAKQLEADMAGEDIDAEAAGRLKDEGNRRFKAGKIDSCIEAYEAGLARAPFKPLPEPQTKGPDDGMQAAADGTAAAPTEDAVPSGQKTDAGLESTAAAAGVSESTDNADEKKVTAAEAEDTTDYTVSSQLLCNLGFALMKAGRYEEAAERLTEAIRHDGAYGKAFFRRACCNWETKQFAAASADYESAEVNGVHLDAEHRGRKAEAKAKADEEMKKMLGQLKDLGNMFLGKFGLSTDNFQFKKDPSTGSYSMNFNQNAGAEGGAAQQ